MQSQMKGTANSSKGFNMMGAQREMVSSQQHVIQKQGMGNQLKQNINVQNKKPTPVTGMGASQLNISNMSKQSTNVLKHTATQFKQDSRSPPKFFQQNPP